MTLPKHLTALFTLFILVSSCSKKTDTGMNYSVNGLTDITIRQYVDTTFAIPLAAAYISGPQEQVTITVENVPAGLTATPTTISGTPAFGSYIMVTGHVETAGTFVVNVSSKSPSTDKKTFKLNIIVTNGVPFVYNFTGLGDITIPRYVDTTIALPVNVTYASGQNQWVTVKADGLPAGVTASPDSIGGLPPFSRTFNMHVAGTLAVGTYPFTYHTVSASNGSRAETHNITIAPSSNCAPQISGTFQRYTTCTSWTGAGTGTDSGPITLNSITNEALINVPFITLTANLNCSAGTLTTQPKTNSSFSVPAGNGTFKYDTIIVHYTLTGDINSDCTTRFTR